MRSSDRIIMAIMRAHLADLQTMRDHMSEEQLHATDLIEQALAEGIDDDERVRRMEKAMDAIASLPNLAA